MKKKPIFVPQEQDLHCPLADDYPDFFSHLLLSYSERLNQGNLWLMRTCVHVSEIPVNPRQFTSHPIDCHVAADTVTVFYDRGWDGWMASLTRWTWVWAGSGSWSWTGKPGVLQSRGHKNLDMTERLNWTHSILHGHIKSRVALLAPTPQILLSLLLACGPTGTGRQDNKSRISPNPILHWNSTSASHGVERRGVGFVLDSV